MARAKRVGATSVARIETERSSTRIEVAPFEFGQPPVDQQLRPHRRADEGGKGQERQAQGDEVATRRRDSGRRAGAFTEGGVSQEGVLA